MAIDSDLDRPPLAAPPSVAHARPAGEATPRDRADRRAKSLASRLRAVLLSEYFVLYLTIAYFVVLLPFFPTLGTPQNLANTLSNVWPLLAVAVGQTLVLTIAAIDLSQGVVVGLTSVVGAVLLATAGDPAVLSAAPIWGSVLDEQGGLLAGSAYGLPAALAAMLAVGAFIGLVNGVAVARFRIPAFMMTLVTLIVVGALSLYLTQSENISSLPESYIALGKGDLVSFYLGEKAEPQIARREIYSLVTYPMVIALALAVAVHILLGRTVFGRRVYAIGINRKAAAISGVPVERVIILVFVLSSVCATIGGLLYSARLEAGRPTLGEGTFLLDVIGATVIGGTSLFGGKAKIVWTFFGVLFFVLLSNTLNAMDLSSFHIDMVKGAVILGAALLDVARTRLLAGEP